MKRIVFAAMLAITAMTTPAVQAADVGVSINIGQPGFYGRIDLGNAPAPQLYYREPVWVQRAAVRPAPIYLYVPHGHQSDWKRYCRQYGACGQPVYFVRDNWYRDVYVPHYRDYHDDRGGWRSERREDRREERREDRQDDWRDKHGKDKHKDKDKDHYKDKGHGKGKGKHDD